MSCTGFSTLQWGGPKCRKSGHLAADTTKSSGSLRSLQMTPSHRATCRESPGSLWAGAACPQSWEFSGKCPDSLARKPSELGERHPRAATQEPRQAAPFDRLRDWPEVLISSHAVPTLVSGCGSKPSKRTCPSLPFVTVFLFTSSVERFVLQLQVFSRYLQTFTRVLVDKVRGWT